MKITAKSPILEVAILGAGSMGRRHARVLPQVQGFSLAGIFDVHPDRARDAALQAGTRTFASELEALEAAALVVVATPISAHAGAAGRALERGLDVLVEKPLCHRSIDAFALCELATRHGAGLWVAHSERFNPVVRALRANLHGAEIVDIKLYRAAPPPQKAPLHGVLTDLGVHDLDLVAFLTGAECSVTDAYAPPGDRPLDSMTVELRTTTGTTAVVRTSRVARERGRVLVVRTAEATFRGDLLHPALVRECARTKRVERLSLTTTEPLVAQARDLRRALDTNVSACATGQDGARAVALAEQAEKLSVPRSSWYAQKYGSMG